MGILAVLILLLSRFVVVGMDCVLLTLLVWALEE
jgi:hypothetical protein